jgi:hypothetical protein
VTAFLLDSFLRELEMTEWQLENYVVCLGNSVAIVTFIIGCRNLKRNVLNLELIGYKI